MFSLTDQQTKINHFSPRMEKHGDENVLAGTLKCETTMHNSVLDNFDKSLRKLLYRKPAAGEQADLPLGDSDGLTARVDEGMGERIAEETMQAWGGRVPKYSFDFRGLIADGIRRSLESIGAIHPAAPVGVPDGWSGWCTQYPDRLPKLWGAREIAELNYYPEEGQRMFQVVEVSATPSAPQEVE